jgi:hypothetical protein
MGKQHPALAPVEKPDPQFFLQLTNLIAERGLRNVHSLGGPSKVEFFGDGDKVTKVSQFH